jgi:hypothetical protein
VARRQMRLAMICKSRNRVAARDQSSMSHGATCPAQYPRSAYRETTKLKKKRLTGEIPARGRLFSNRTRSIGFPTITGSRF